MPVDLAICAIKNPEWAVLLSPLSLSVHIPAALPLTRRLGHKVSGGIVFHIWASPEQGRFGHSSILSLLLLVRLSVCMCMSNR